MKQVIFRFASLVSVSILASCGGGGGGGGGTSTTGVRVLHGAIEATPVDLNTDAQPVSLTVGYAGAGGYLPLGEGQHLLQLSESKGGAGSLFSQSITNDGDQKFTLLFYGDRGALGLHTALIKESRPVIAEGGTVVRVIHGAAGAASLSLSIAGASSTANFGSTSKYIDLAPGIYPYTVRRVSDGAIVSSGTISTEAGNAYSVFVAGEVGYLVNSLILDE